ncbi:NADP-dependent oxidoreductase [Saccharothrix violaceirubra]|uniref:NADPH:quinone reductase-like Zn-dependent oxidoreductase n=1 Tax=Saccharothrix violaceirubra TaxID=413306 RepID=A0A7W7WVN4_9PSEU|nr:NADP-dependent oxidoreductase [Saccharothrix violaceirubra]MBB4965072.1 NADPH:quinone reductase-like Zn-dependent oxidoreductase [Saccharothrix violaceirubra]
MTRAVVLSGYGGPEVLVEADVPTPSPGPGQVLIAVRAIGLNPFDVKVRSGAFRDVMPLDLPAVLGLEAAGVVVESTVDDFAVGDEVFGLVDGGAYAERALATAVARKPVGLDWSLAAALPVAVEVTGRVLRALDVAQGETVLVNGAAGAVGTIAVQMSVARGARVVGTAGDANQDHLRSLGATPVRYGAGLVDRVREISPGGVDAVFDVAGRGALPDSIALAGGPDRVVTIADPEAERHGVRFSGGAEPDPGEFAAVAEAVAAGRFTVTIDRTFPLSEAAAAHAWLEAGHTRGKSILLP